MCNINFRFSNDMVTIMVRKNKSKDHSHQERIRGFTDYEKDAPTFCLQFLMSYTKKRRIPQLEWKKYSVCVHNVLVKRRRRRRTKM